MQVGEDRLGPRRRCRAGHHQHGPAGAPSQMPGRLPPPLWLGARSCGLL